MSDHDGLVEAALDAINAAVESDVRSAAEAEATSNEGNEGNDDGE